MEVFMHVFESQEAAEAEMRQQVDSYSHTLATALLAAGHLPPSWLLPRPTTLARRGSVETRMRKQVDSYSQSLACALLAAGYQPPPWLLPPFDDAATQEDEPSFHEGTNSVVSPLLEKELTAVDSLEKPCLIASSLLNKDTLHRVHPNSHERHYFVCNPLDKIKAHAADAESLEGPNPVVTQLLENDSSHSDNLKFLEGPDFVSSPMPQKGAIETSENVSIEVQHSTTIVLPEEDTSNLGETGSLENPLPMASLLLERESTSTESLEVQYGMPNRQLDEETGRTSDMTSSDGPFCLLSSKLKMNPGQTIEYTAKKSSILDKCIKKSSRILEQQSSGCHVQPASFNESMLQPAQVANITSEANDLCVGNNMDASANSQAPSSASCKSTRLLHTAERNCKVSTDKCLTGAEQKVCCSNNVMEINGNLCATVGDNYTKSPPSSTHNLFSSLGSSECFVPLKSDIQETNFIGTLLLEKEPGLTGLHGGPHPIASPLLEKATRHFVKSYLLQEPYSVPSVRLDMEAGHTSECVHLKDLIF